MEGIQLPARKKGQGKRATCCIPLQILKTLDSVLEVVMHGGLQGSSLTTVEKSLEVRLCQEQGSRGLFLAVPKRDVCTPRASTKAAEGALRVLPGAPALAAGTAEPLPSPPTLFTLSSPEGSRAESCWDAASVQGEPSPAGLLFCPPHGP